MSDPNLFDVPVRVWVSCRGEITLETMVSDDGDRLVPRFDECTSTFRQVWGFSNIYRTCGFSNIYRTCSAGTKTAVRIVLLSRLDSVTVIFT